MGVALALEARGGVAAQPREREISKLIYSRYRLAREQGVTTTGPPYRSKEEFTLGGLRVKRGEWAWPLGGVMEATVLEFDVPGLGPVEVKLGDRIAAGLELLKLVLVAVAAPDVVESAMKMADGRDLFLYVLLENALEAAEIASRAVSPEHARLLLKALEEADPAGLARVYVDRSGRKWTLYGAYLHGKFLDPDSFILSMIDEEGRGFLWVGRNIPPDVARRMFEELEKMGKPIEPKEPIPPEAVEALIREYTEVANALADALRVFTADEEETAPLPTALSGDMILAKLLDTVYELQGEAS